MVILQPDVPLKRPIAILQLADHLTVQRYLHALSPCLDLKIIPLPEGPRRDLRRGHELVDCSGLM